MRYLFVRANSLFPTRNEVSIRGGNGYGAESRSDALDAGKNRRAVGHETTGEEGAELRADFEEPYKLGSYHLRYTQNGKRIWEAVGNDLTLALQEQRARQRALETPAVPVAVTTLPKRNLRDVAEFLNGKENKNWCHILTVFGDWWGWEKHVEDFQRPDFKAFAKYVASLPL